MKVGIVSGVVGFTLLLGVYTANFWPKYETGSNFDMYYTAAHLVRSGMSRDIYNVFDPNTNPQQLFADPQSVFAKVARDYGLHRITLYLYPPTLADMIVPLTIFRPSTALLIWNFGNVLMIFGVSLVLARILHINFWGAPAWICAAILLFRPVLNTFHWGQVSILLVFLLTIGFYAYVQEHKDIAAFLFVLAIAIKLEPIVVIIPLIAWRDWKCLRSMGMWSVLLGIGLLGINGSDALNLYFLHQLPAMSGGISGNVNRSLGNIFYTLFGGANPIMSSQGLSWLVKGVSALILCYAGWLSRVRDKSCASGRQKCEIGMIFLLFACCLSPYSWFYNWALSAPALVVFCKRSWDGNADTVEAVLLIGILLSLSTSKLSMAMITPILGIVLGFVGLRHIQLEQEDSELREMAIVPAKLASS